MLFFKAYDHLSKGYVLRVATVLNGNDRDKRNGPVLFPCGDEVAPALPWSLGRVGHPLPGSESKIGSQKQRGPKRHDSYSQYHHLRHAISSRRSE